MKSVVATVDRDPAYESHRGSDSGRTNDSRSECKLLLFSRSSPAVETSRDMCHAVDRVFRDTASRAVGTKACGTANQPRKILL